MTFHVVCHDCDFEDLWGTELEAEDVYFGRDLTPIGGRARRNKISKLQEYDLIEYEGPAQNRVYRVRDEAIEPPVDDLGLNQHLAE
jgi:hypothetical protein